MREKTRTSAAVDQFRSAGFTLLELLIVLAIIGVVGAVAMPRMRVPAEATQAHAAARMIASALADARQQAIFANREVRVRFDFEAYRFAVGEAPPRALPSSLTLALETLEQEVVDGRTGRIAFFPDGSSSGGTILVADQRTGRVRLTVNWLTGRIAIDG